MATPNYHNFVYTQSVNPGHQQFETIGHPGSYTGVYKHRTGEFYFTGSNYGYGAMMIGSGSGATFSTEADHEIPDFLELSEGGKINLSDLVHSDDVESTRPQIYDFSAYRVSSSLGTPDIYFFKRQQ